MELVRFQKALIEELAVILEIPVDVDTDLLSDAGLDSFGTMQIIIFLEEEFGIQVEEDQFDIKDYASVATITRWALPMITVARAHE